MAKLANSLGVLGGIVVAVDLGKRKATVAFVGQQGTFELPLDKCGKPVMGSRSWSLQSDEVRQKVGVGTHVFASISGMKVDRWCTRDRFAEVVDTLSPRMRNDIERPKFSKEAARTLMQKFMAAAKSPQPEPAPAQRAEQAVAA
jgi:hypothetical protein